MKTIAGTNSSLLGCYDLVVSLNVNFCVVIR